MKILLICAAVVVLVVVGFVTMKKPATAPAPTGTPQGALGIKSDVSISGFAFSPATATVPKGATVVWTNKDAAPHQLVSDSGTAISTKPMQQGDSAAVTFSTPGTYSYHCSIHPSMKGTIIVQ